MVSMLAYPKLLADAAKGAVITFVVPSTVGCGMHCPHCYIRQRKETSIKSLLTPKDYEDFVEGIYYERIVACVSIQGVEPLASDSIEYTDRILKKTTELNIPSAVVTNGVSLRDTWRILNKHRIDEIAISLDAYNPKDHDSIRGVPGAFNKVVEGIKVAAKQTKLCNVFSIASVLLPNKGHVLEKMPELLCELGINKWFVTPIIRIGSALGGQPVEKLCAIESTLQRLNKIAKKSGIQMIVEDEFNNYDCERKISQGAKELVFRNLDNPHGLIRLQPSGACEIGRQLLKEYDVQSPKWIPGKESVPMFYLRAMSHWNSRNSTKN